MEALPRLRPLGLREEVRLSPEQMAMVRSLEAYDLWFVETRLVRKGLVPPERIAGAILEFKRYMALVGLGYRGLGMLSREVDEVWHALILFTRDYDQFCRTTVGDFVHHVPRTSRTPVGDNGTPRFLRAYREVFGPPPVEWYGIPARSDADEPSGCGTEDCTGD